MTQWRMAFRSGSRGQELWPECRRRGIAAITYRPLHTTNLTNYAPYEPANLWAKLTPTQKASLRRVAYEMRRGDVIYVKQGPMIVGRGEVQSRYRFDEALSLKDKHGLPWPHHVRVNWDSSFRPVRMLLGVEQLTVRRLNAQDLRRIGRAVQASPDPSDIDDELAAFEGSIRKLFVVHRQRERWLREQKLAAFQRDHGGRLYCEVRGCGFDFNKVYGDLGDGYAQVHHVRSLSRLRAPRQTTLKDLVIVCANCHAMIHRRGACRRLSAISKVLRSRSKRA